MKEMLIGSLCASRGLRKRLELFLRIAIAFPLQAQAPPTDEITRMPPS
jgi:hypothetical protein